MNEIAGSRETLDTQLRAVIAADPLHALAAVTSLRALIADRERDAVRQALEHHSWSEIGNALGVSKQAAFQRFGKQWISDMKVTMTKSEMKQSVRNRLANK